MAKMTRLELEDKRQNRINKAQNMKILINSYFMNHCFKTLEKL